MQKMKHIKHDITLKIREHIIRELDTLDNFNEKLEFLNNCFLIAETKEQEKEILDIIKYLKEFG